MADNPVWRYFMPDDSALQDFKFIRAFEQKNYAEEFISGKIRITPITNYGKETLKGDQRYDPTEGLAQIFHRITPCNSKCFNLFGYGERTFLVNKAIESGFVSDGDLLRIEWPVNFYQLSIGIFKGPQLSAAMKSRYKGFGKYWVQGELSELITKLFASKSTILGYKVAYSDKLAGFWVKSTGFKAENEFKILFKKTSGLEDTEPTYFKIPKFKTTKLFIY